MPDISSRPQSTHSSAQANPVLSAAQFAMSSRALWLCVLVLALIWFVPLGWRHLVPSDEGRYAEMAREMFLTGDWITPRYNGYKYFEKPPLQTWANALTFAWFGIGDWQARLYTALTGFAGILLLAYTGSRVFGRVVGVAAGLILATSPYWTLMGHFNTLDMGLSFWMQLTLCALLIAQTAVPGSATQRGWMLASWAGMAMAVLSKGLVGLILPGSVLIIYSLVQRDWQIWRRMYFVPGILLFLFIVLPWFVLVQIKNPDFFHFFFIVQQFQRYLTPDQHRPGPIYYFVPILVIGFLPWLPLVWGATKAARQRSMPAHRFSPVMFLLVWTVFIFVFFSVSHSKLLSYTLPIAPSIALLLALAVPAMSMRRMRFYLLAYLVVLVAAFIGASFIGNSGSDTTPNALYRKFEHWVYGAIAVAFVVTLIALWINRRHRFGGLFAFGAAWLLLTSIAGVGHETFGRYSSGVLLAPAIKAAMAQQPPDTPFYSVDKLDHTLPFYIGHTMIMVASADELNFGVHAEPEKWVPTIAEWESRWRAEPHAFALMSVQRYDAYKASGLPMQVVARDERRVVVEKPGT